MHYTISIVVFQSPKIAFNFCARAYIRTSMPTNKLTAVYFLTNHLQVH